MDLTALRFEVYQRLRLDNTASGNDETLVTRALNEGVREVLSRTHCYVVCADLNTIGDTWKYRMPTSVLAVKRVLSPDSSGTDQEAVLASEADIFQLRESTIGVTQTALRYTILGADLLLIWPTPSTAGTLEVFYVPKPTEMSSGTHDPSNATYGGIPTEYHHAIVLYALAQLADREQHSGSQGGMKYTAEFDQFIVRIKADLNRRKGRNLAAARPGRRSRKVPVANDADWTW